MEVEQVSNPVEGARSTERADDDGHRFLTQKRIVQIGTLVAPMLDDGLSWIERRKESVQLLDDTALRREISVDFSLRRDVDPLLKELKGSPDEQLFCAPVFVLPKSPSNLMAFDLCDEESKSLALISLEDNARISGEVLVQMVRRAAEDQLSEALADELRRLARLEGPRAEQLAARLLSDDGPWPEINAAVKRNDRLRLWISTLAHSLILVVLYRSAGPRRKLVKLTFEEPILTDQRSLTRLGWASYRVAIDSPLIEARSFHFEAESPPGLRISKAQLTDTERDEPATETGFMKRVHLYRRGAERAGAGTAVLWLDVSGPGFIGGAVMASSLTLAALVGCAVKATEITENPTSAPALLLVLPGLIASYVARPDQHALTTRLLSAARRLLLAVAFCAYLAAATVALSGSRPEADELTERSSSLRTWLLSLAVVSGVCLVGLGVTWLRSKGRPLPFSSADRYRCSQAVAMSPAGVAWALGDPNADCPIPKHYTAANPAKEGEIVLSRSAWHGEWLLTIEIEEIAGESLLSATLDYISLLPASVALPYLHRREATQIAKGLAEIAEWAKATDTNGPSVN